MPNSDMYVPGYTEDKDKMIKNLYNAYVENAQRMQWLLSNLNEKNITRLQAFNGWNIVDRNGINPRFIKKFPNKVPNSSFEVFDSVTKVPVHWTAGESTASAAYEGTYSCKLAAGISTQTLPTASIYINPQWWDNISKKTRVTFQHKLGSVKVEVLDHSSGDAAFTLTDEGGNTGASKTYAANTNWGPETLHTVVFTHAASTNILIKFTDMEVSDACYIDAVEIEPDWDGKYPSFYTDGPYSLSDGTGAVFTIHDAVTAGTGISVIGQEVSNTDLGSAAVSTHEGTYDHTLLHDPVTAGDGISVEGQQVTNADTGSAAVGTHEGTFDHTLLHPQAHDMDSASDHNAADAADYGKFIRSNPSTGAIEFDSDNTVTTDNMDLYVGYPLSLVGTVEVGAGTLSKIDGTDTQFLTDLSADDYIFIAGALGEVRKVISVDSDTQLTVDAAYSGAIAAGKTLQVFKAGDDANDGSAADVDHALATWSEAFARLPQTILHSVVIHIAPGEYSEDAGFGYKLGNGSIEITTDYLSASADYFLVNSLTLEYINPYISVTKIRLMSDALDNITIGNCNSVYLESIKSVESGAESGIYAYLSKVNIFDCLISNKTYATYSGFGTEILSDTNTGSGNDYGLYVAPGGYIHKTSTQPTGTVANELIDPSGVIFPLATDCIADEAVTLAKMAHIATGSLLGRNTALAGDVEVITDIPTAITIGGKYIYRADGTDVPVADGGTGLSAIAAGSILAANSANTLSAVTSAAGLTVLKSNGGTVSWNATTGTGDSVMATSPTFVTQITTPRINGDATGLYLYDDGTNYAFLKDGGLLGLMCTPTYRLDIADGNGIAVLIGADSGATTRTNATTKAGRFGVPHYTNTEEPVALFVGASANGYNLVNFGGGAANCNAATYIGFWIAATATTLQGTERLRITDAGFGFGTTVPLSFIDIQKAGTAKTNLDILALTNKVNAADMDNTQTSILFYQYYYSAVTPAAANAARITVGTETDWTSTASTQDAYMAIHTALDGTVAEKARYTSMGNHLLGVTTCDTTATKSLVIGNGTAPAAHVDDMIHIYSTDISGGDATLGLMVEAAVAADGDETKFDNKLPVKINGTTYYIMLTTT